MPNNLYHQSSIFAEQIDKFINNGCQQMINGKLIMKINHTDYQMIMIWMYHDEFYK